MIYVYRGIEWEVDIDHDPGYGPTAGCGGVPGLSSARVRALALVSATDLLISEPFPWLSEERAEGLIPAWDRIQARGGPLAPRLARYLEELLADDVESHVADECALL
jgi:hypothetical protein